MSLGGLKARLESYFFVMCQYLADRANKDHENWSQTYYSYLQIPHSVMKIYSRGHFQGRKYFQWGHYTWTLEWPIITPEIYGCVGIWSWVSQVYLQSSSTEISKAPRSPLSAPYDTWAIRSAMPLLAWLWKGDRKEASESKVHYGAKRRPGVVKEGDIAERLEEPNLAMPLHLACAYDIVIDSVGCGSPPWGWFNELLYGVLQTLLTFLPPYNHHQQHHHHIGHLEYM